MAPPATPAGSVPRFETIQLLGQSHQPRTKTPINFLIHTEEGNASALDLAGEGAIVLDLSQLLSGVAQIGSTLDDYLSFAFSGSTTTIGRCA